MEIWFDFDDGFDDLKSTCSLFSDDWLHIVLDHNVMYIQKNSPCGKLGKLGFGNCDAWPETTDKW